MVAGCCSPPATLARRGGRVLANRGGVSCRSLCLAPMADELKPAYLIAGTDRPKIDRAVERLRGRFDADAVEIHPRGELTGDDAVAACNALGLFAGDGRLIVVEGVEAWKAEDVKEIAAYLKAPAPGDHARARRRRAEEGLRRSRRRSRPARASCSSGTSRRRRSSGGSREQFALHGTKAEPEACRALIELVGDDVYELSSEIDKLATWAAGEPRDRRRCRAARRRARRDDQLRAHRRVGRPRRRRCPARLRGAARALGRPALEDDPARRRHPHEPRRPDPRAPRRSRRRESPAKDAAVTLKRHPYYVGKLYPQGRNYTPEELRTRHRPARRARPRAQGRLAPRGRPRARAGADRDHLAPRLIARVRGESARS